MIRAATFKGKTVAVFGLGISGAATVRSLLEGGASVAAWDDSDAGRAAAEKAGIALTDLRLADWSKFSSLVLAPGVPLTHPEPHWAVRRAIDAAVEIIGDVEIFARERAAHCAQAPFIAITGTNGKSTTTALIAHILKSAGRDVQMGGNIGVPVLALEPAAPDRFHVIEMSSFQIDLTPTLNPAVGVLLNITPDHLDRHGTIDHYAAIKERLVIGAQEAVVGVDDSFGLAISAKPAMQSKPLVKISTRRGTIDNGLQATGGRLSWVSVGQVQDSFDISGISSLRGDHNAQNMAAAFAALSPFLPADIIVRHMRSFPGLAHRMEEIGHRPQTGGKVLFINDSKATNAESTGKALLSFPRDVFWILGGKPKDGGIECLRPYFAGIVRAYLIGEASEEFSQTLDGDVAIVPCGTLDVAVARAAADAAAYARGEAMLLYNVQGSIGAGTPAPGQVPQLAASPITDPVVLLSPACASYDQFKNFEVRGDAFRASVGKLPGIELKGRP